MTSFFVIASFRLEKINFQVFVLNSSSQFHAIKKKAWVNMFNIHLKNKPGRKPSILKYIRTSWPLTYLLICLT